MDGIRLAARVGSVEQPGGKSQMLEQDRSVVCWVLIYTTATKYERDNNPCIIYNIRGDAQPPFVAFITRLLL